MHTHSTLTIARPPIFLVPLLAGMLLLATGCSSTHRVMEPSGEPSGGREASRSEAYGYSRVTEDVSGETVRVFLRDGREMELENLYVGPDSTTGTLPQGGKKTVPTSALQEIEVVNRGTGFLQGAGIGIAVPLASGVLGSAMEDDELIPAWAIGAVLSVPGGLVGGIAGLIRGQRKTYRFLEPSSETNSKAIPARSRLSSEPPHK